MNFYLLHKNTPHCGKNLCILHKKNFRLCRPITKITNDVNNFLYKLYKNFFVYFAQNYFCAICTNLGVVHHAQKSLTLLIVFVHPAQKKFRLCRSFSIPNGSMSIIPHCGSFVKAFYKKNKKIFFAQMFEQAQDFISEQMFVKRWQGSVFEQMFDGAPKSF